MVADQPKGPIDKSPFWRFSIKFYAEPGVAPACIALQDEAGVDVNVLFFLLWSATQGRRFDRGGVEAIDGAVGPWRDMTVKPLREVRRALKLPPAALPRAVAEGFRTRIKAAELEAERLQQEALYAMAQSGPAGHAAATPLDAARDSVAAYETMLKPFPRPAIDAVLAAFSRFQPPA